MKSYMKLMVVELVVCDW